MTFGEASAPFQGIRTFKQIAMDNKEKFPLGASILDKEFYVDDILSGADHIQTAITKQNELVAILRSSGFELRKWGTNCEEILKDVPDEHREKGTKMEFD